MNRKEYLEITRLLDEINAVEIELDSDEYLWLKKLVVSWAARQGIGLDVDFDILTQAVRFGIGVAVLSMRRERAQRNVPLLIISRTAEAA